MYIYLSLCQFCKLAVIATAAAARNMYDCSSKQQKRAKQSARNNTFKQKRFLNIILWSTLCLRTTHKKNKKKKKKNFCGIFRTTIRGVLPSHIHPPHHIGYIHLFAAPSQPAILIPYLSSLIHFISLIHSHIPNVYT